MMIGIGDDIIISGKVADILTYEDGELLGIWVDLPSGLRLLISEKDIKSYHPYRPIPETDERRGQ